MTHRLSASIVLYKTPVHFVRRSLDCLLRSCVSKVWIIDHSPTDELEQVCRVDDRIEYLRQKNRGYGAGNNVALRRSLEQGFEYHLVLNPDVYWEEDVIETLLGYLDNTPDAAMVMPRVLYPDGRFQLQAKPLPTPADFILSRVGLKRSWKNRLISEQQKYTQPMVFPFLSGCFMLLRNNAVRIAGIFDERYFMYCEDLDLTRRLNTLYKTVYYPGTTIYHNLNRQSAHNLRLFLIHLSSAWKYFRKWRKKGCQHQFDIT